MTSKDSYYQKECNKIDANCINAYLELKLDDQDPSKLILDHSWGETSVDLEPAVKGAETIQLHYNMTQSAANQIVSMEMTFPASSR